MAEVLASLVPAVQRLLRRHGVEDEEVADSFAEAEPILAGWAAASVGGPFCARGPCASAC
jgi:hypothetical protein